MKTFPVGAANDCGACCAAPNIPDGAGFVEAKLSGCCCCCVGDVANIEPKLFDCAPKIDAPGACWTGWDDPKIELWGAGCGADPKIDCCVACWPKENVKLDAADGAGSMGAPKMEFCGGDWNGLLFVVPPKMLPAFMAVDCCC